MTINTTLRTIGDHAPRVDAKEKASGRAIYTVDIILPRMLHAKILRSAVGHARLVNINVDKAISAPGVHAVLSRENLDQVASSHYGYFIKDQPIVATDKLRYEGDTIAAVAAEIIPGRPPAKALITAIENEAYSPTFGSTPAMIEKAIASGIRARATTRPANMSPRTFENQSFFT